MICFKYVLPRNSKSKVIGRLESLGRRGGAEKGEQGQGSADNTGDAIHKCHESVALPHPLVPKHHTTVS